MAVANGEPKKKRHRWFEEFLLSLDPRKPYSTGDIVSEWEGNQQISREMQVKHDKNPKVAQPSLSRYMPERYRMFIKSSSDPNPEASPTALIYQPVKTEIYKPTGHEQQIYLGAQYAWVAADQLGLEQPMPEEEVLELLEKVLESETSESVKQVENSNVFVEDSVESTQAVSVLDGGHAGIGRSEPVKVKKRSLRKRFLRWRVPLSFAMSALSLVVCVGVVGGSVYFKSYPELEQLKKAHEEGGLGAVKRLAKQNKNKKSLGQLITVAWAKVHDPDESIEEIQSLIKPLHDHPNPGWQAKGHYLLGVSYLVRRKVHESMESFSKSETNLAGTRSQVNDLRDTYLGLAECYFFLGDSDGVLKNTKKATLLQTMHHKGKVHHHMSKYWLLERDLEKSIEESLKSIQLSYIENDKTYLAVYLAHHALLLISKGELEESFNLLKKAQLITINQNNPTLLEYILSYEQLWAQEMKLPISNLSSEPLKGTFPNNRYYIEMIQSLAMEAN
ncbi:tetratricopeptide repeat protein [Acanthopleuribacter pedis]|uniref:Uncharacterized protein n=1 Tax=Acanthopleuribacter pedis TaxID=442870 RepID=A0A8J7QA58_9BACT|nr:hypothetical protein [Acanthopleuribacter pedis]MBO1320259.1 hypothetical protein [Acanthopleuribacter pedis]